jgi:hypothetical protein
MTLAISAALLGLGFCLGLAVRGRNETDQPDRVSSIWLAHDTLRRGRGWL